MARGSLGFSGDRVGVTAMSNQNRRLASLTYDFQIFGSSVAAKMMPAIARMNDAMNAGTLTQNEKSRPTLERNESNPTYKRYKTNIPAPANPRAIALAMYWSHPPRVRRLRTRSTSRGTLDPYLLSSHVHKC